MIRYSQGSFVNMHRHFELLEMKLRQVGEPADIYALDVIRADPFTVTPGSPFWCLAVTLDPDADAAVEGNPYWERAKACALAAREAGKRVALVGVPLRSVPSEDHSLFDRFIY